MIYYILTNKGGREINEDYAGTAGPNEDKSFCAILADGLGGHGRGEVASESVVKNSLSLWKEFSGDTEVFLKQCFEDSQEKLLKKQEEENAEGEMKTTMTALVSNGSTLQWGHIGDSRLYCFRGNKLVTRTLDHSVPQMLVASGEIKEKDIRGHEDRNRLLRVMGAPWDKPRYELAEAMDCESSLSFLLCSDGFWELIEEKDMISCLKQSSSPKEWLEKMEVIVQKNGVGKNMDNYTAVGIFMGEERKGEESSGSFLKSLFQFGKKG